MVKAVISSSASTRRRKRKSVKEEIHEGLLLLEYSTRIKLKNIIVVETLTTDGAVDFGSWTQTAEQLLSKLSLETDASARRMGRELAATQHLAGGGDHEHDYRAEDGKNLRKRRRIYRGVSQGLQRWAADPSEIRTLLEAARADAWAEIDAEIQRVVSASEAVSAVDESVLRERLKLITTVDLPTLARSRNFKRSEGSAGH